MIDLQAMFRRKWVKRTLIGLVLADLLGVYLVQQRLNQPPAEGAGEDMFAAADPSREDYDDPILSPPKPKQEELSSTPALAQADLPIPASPRMPAVPAEPSLEAAADLAAAEAPTVVPTVRLAAREADAVKPKAVKAPLVRQPRTRFDSAFSSGLPRPAAIEAGAPSYAGAEARAPADEVFATGTALADEGPDAGALAPAVATDAPAPAAADSVSAPAPEAAPAPAPELPAADFAPAAEAPAN